MSKKIVIASIILALIFVAGFGINYVSNYQSQATSAEKETRESSSEPIAKLVYTGTNETLSEALYHLDLQDGKLDEPHVVVTIEKIKPSDEYKSKRTKFIGKSNKIVKEINFPYNFDIQIYKDIGCVSVMEKVPRPEYNDFMTQFHFYDLAGNLLWRTGVGDMGYKVFAGPHYLAHWGGMF